MVYLILCLFVHSYISRWRIQIRPKPEAVVLVLYADAVQRAVLHAESGLDAERCLNAERMLNQTKTGVVVVSAACPAVHVWP